MEIRDTYAYGIAIPNEGQPFTGSPSRHQLTLEDHVARLHVDLVELPQRPWTVLDDVRYSVYSGFKVNVPLLCHKGEHHDTPQLDSLSVKFDGFWALDSSRWSETAILKLPASIPRARRPASPR